MNRSGNILSGRNAFATALLVVAVVMAFLAPNAAVNVDEQLHYPHAKKVVNWYFTRGEDVSCLDTPQSNLKYYGQSVDNFTALVNRVFHVKNEFLVRHFTGAFFFLLLLLFSGLIAKQLTGSYWSSVIVIFAIVFMPRVFGQAFGNLKDIPFATGYVAGIYMIIRFLKELPRPRWSTAILLGLAIAFTCSVRIGGLILFAYLALFSAIYFIWKPFELKQIVSTKPCFVGLMGQLTVIVIIGYFAGLLLWPYALQNVWVNPLESLSVMEHYKVSIRQIFEGNLLWSTQLPSYYVFKWLAISTPEFIFVGFGLFLILFIRKLSSKKIQFNSVYFESLVAFTFFFPVVYVFTIHANLYSGVRQLIFVLPVLAVLISAAIFNFLKSDFKKKIKYPVSIIYFLLMLLPFTHQAKTFPADYIYFNSISGGNKSAWSNYEYDYYFHGIKIPADELIEMISKNQNVIVASNCNLSNYFDNSPNITYRYVRYLERSSMDWDYGLFGINYIHPYQLKNNTWQSTEIVKTYYHKGNPIAVLLKRKDKNGLKGINLVENGNLDEGKKFLKEALKYDPNNVWLDVYLAKVSLLQNDDQEFNLYIQKGKKIYPYYEPIFMLEAQKWFNEGDFQESFVTLQELLNINPRYQPAAPFLNAVKDKLNK
jgi:tetratricopeptide (TPR) repeat protein